MMATACPCCGSDIVDNERVLIDFDGAMVVANGHIARLTISEFEVFEALWRNKPRTLSKEQLFDATSRDMTGNDDRELKIVDVFICKARKKLEPLGLKITTVWGSGYRIVPEQGAGQ